MSQQNSAWRFECCNRLLNVLADHTDVVLQINIRPMRKRQNGFACIITASDTQGRVLALCGHDVIPAMRSSWLDNMFVTAFRTLFD